MAGGNVRGGFDIGSKEAPEPSFRECHITVSQRRSMFVKWSLAPRLCLQHSGAVGRLFFPGTPGERSSPFPEAS